jgi:hypothetical protein
VDSFYTVTAMKPRTLPIVLSLTVIALLILTQAGAQGVEWKVWVNPRQDTGLPRTWVELSQAPTRGYTDDDGGYTVHIYFRASPKIYWGGKLIDYEEKYAVFTQRIVSLWNASLKFAAENYEWARHLSKLRLKFYTDANVSRARYTDVLVDASKPPCPGAYACAVYGHYYTEIWGNLDAFSHELGHALGLGHNYKGVPWGYVEEGRDWRGWKVGGMYPSEPPYGAYVLTPPPDSFVLYALAYRWSSLKNSTAETPLAFPKNTAIWYKDVAKDLGPLYSQPGLVWFYLYSVLREGNDERPYPSPFILSIPKGIYGEDLCTEFPPSRSGALPIVEEYNNGTALVVHGFDLQLALVDREMRAVKGGVPRYYAFYELPLKHLSDSFLNELVKTRRNGTLIELVVYGSLDPAWDKVSGVYFRGDSICLRNLKERLLVEAQQGRAYRVDAGMAEAVPINGWSYRDGKGINWVLRGSTVYFRPLNSTYYGPYEGVRYVWRGVNFTLTVERPVVGGALLDRLWKKQYLVEVDSPYPFEGVGWFDEGSKVSPKPVGGYVDFGNGTRLALKGFQGYNGTEIVVGRPLKLKPVWERMHRVDTISRYVFTETGKYFKEGETIFTLMPRVQDFGNGTKAELLNMTAYGPRGETVDAWDGKLGGERNGLLQVVLDRPLKIEVEWKVYHRLTVSSPVNSYETWVLNGTVHRLDLPEKKLVGSDTLMVLKQIKVNGKPQQGLDVTVTSPTSVEAVYQRKLMTTIMVDAGKKYLVEPNEVVLERDGEVEVYRPPFTYIGEGTWKVSKVTYLGGDIAMSATIEVNIAGMKTIPSRLRAVEITVVDLIGLPVPYASVKAENVADVTGISGTTTLPAIPPWDFEASASHILGRGVTTIRPGDATARITAGISPYTIALLAIAVTLGVVAWRRKVSR